MSGLNSLFLCNFDEQQCKSDNKFILRLWSGDWSIQNKELCKEVLGTGLETDALIALLKTKFEGNSSKDEVLSAAISVFLTFIHCNWDPLIAKQLFNLEEYLGTEWPKSIDVQTCLQRDSETIHLNILHPELLYISLQLFNSLHQIDQDVVHLWWYFRAMVMHQVALEDSSATVFGEIETLAAKLCNEASSAGPRMILYSTTHLRVLLYVEIGQAYLLYRRVQKVEEYLLKSRELAGLKLELTGVLGKRTKFQQIALPQLALTSSLEGLLIRPDDHFCGSSELPKQIELNDDVRLEKIHYNEPVKQAKLPSLEQTLCLLTVQYLERAQPRDELMEQELRPYIEAVTSQQTGSWASRVAALLIRCRLEARHRRTVERAMMQAETIVTDTTPVSNTARYELMQQKPRPYIEVVTSQQAGSWASRVAALLIRCRLEARHRRTVERAMMQAETIVTDATPVSITARLSYIWASGLQPAWTWREQLADLYLSLGLTKAALEEYQRLQSWENVIACYTILQLRHKAAEIIQQQIDIKPTVKLYCLLGEATDEIAWFVKAWEFSGQRSSRAQRCWGNFLFDKKEFEECIPHFQKSVEINSIQERVWLRMGYAALMTEQWELSATAYRRYTYLHPNTFEAWNNLAKVYVKQGDKNRAYRALMEALKYNYDNWKLWENVIFISMDTGHFEDVIRGVHRLLDIQNKFEDVELLALLVRAVLQDKEDADGNSSARLRSRVLELFGRITSVHLDKPEIWQCYADISPTYLLKAQRLLKAYGGYTHSGNWSKNPETCKKVIELANSLLWYSLKARQEVEDNELAQANGQLSSARLTGQAVIRAAEKQKWPDTKPALEELKTTFNSLTAYMKTIA